MKKTLVLAEKPSVGRDIARVLNCHKKGNGYLEGEKYIVTWALGHLVTLADPESYDKTYQTWRLEDLPMLPSNLKLVVIKKSGKQFQIVKHQMHRNDVSEIVIATDAGREGELVARWILRKACVKKPIKRLWISSVTDKAILEGFRSLKPGKMYESLYDAAVARSESDWFVGMNATRALTCKFNAQLSCGRVQTPTLFMIGKREEEIQNFKPKTFYQITATVGDIDFLWQDKKSKDVKTFHKDYSNKVFRSIQNQDMKIIKVEKSYKKQFSPSLYDLTELQRDANKYFGYSAKKTLSTMQSLYERHKILTYPRTDSRYLTTDIVDTLKDRIKACGIDKYSKFAKKILSHPIKGHKSFVNNKKVTDHHAIIPTEEVVLLSHLSDSERKIYDLVVKRFLGVLSKPFEYEQISITSYIGEETFVAKGKKVISRGFKELNESLEDEETFNKHLGNIHEGDKLVVSKSIQKEGQTTPPKPFNEGTLLSAMENPSKYMQGMDKGLIQTIGQTGGLGTVATRADIIEKLLNSFLIEKKENYLYITSKGKQLLELVPQDLKSPSLTAKWEQKLEAIAKGKLSRNTFIHEIQDYSRKVVKEIKNSKESFKHDNLVRVKCPECGKYMLEVQGKKGKMLVCQDRECGYRKGIAKKTNARCPNCHKKMELRGQGEGQIFVCMCGYREKLKAFKKRKDKKQNNVSKREVSRYMKAQNKKNDEPINTALADALAKLKGKL